MYINRRCVRKYVHVIVCAVVVITLTFMTGMWIGEVKKNTHQNQSATLSTVRKEHLDNSNNNNKLLKNLVKFNRNENENIVTEVLDKAISNQLKHNNKEEQDRKTGRKTNAMTDAKAYKLRKDGSRVYFFDKLSNASGGTANMFDYPRLKFNRTKIPGNEEDRSYLEFRQLDSPAIGDVHCAGTAVEHSCAFYIQTIDEGKIICRNLRHNCKGFVLTTEGKIDGTSEYLAYMKTDVGNVATNLLTNFFVKTEFIREVKWRPPET